MQAIPRHGGGAPLVGAVGPLQFEVVAARLESEYGVEAATSIGSK